MIRLALIVSAISLFSGCGGAANDQFLSEHRKSNGLVIILPGIEGESSFNHGIRQGLMSAGVDGALPIYKWGRPIPLAGLLLNQVDVIGNRIEAAKVADMIVRYQESYPDRPVYLIGHSGGGGIAVFATEALPQGHNVDGIVLLSASISSMYDLDKALSHCKGGIVNFYNPADVGLLGIGTSIAGNVDGIRGPSAGLNGFARFGHAGDYDRLYQVRVDDVAVEEDAHVAATRASYVSSMVAPWVMSHSWPASGSLALGND